MKFHNKMSEKFEDLKKSKWQSQRQFWMLLSCDKYFSLESVKGAFLYRILWLEGFNNLYMKSKKD